MECDYILRIAYISDIHYRDPQLDVCGGSVFAMCRWGTPCFSTSNVELGFDQLQPSAVVRLASTG